MLGVGIESALRGCHKAMSARSGAAKAEESKKRQRQTKPQRHYSGNRNRKRRRAMPRGASGAIS